MLICETLVFAKCKYLESFQFQIVEDDLERDHHLGRYNKGCNNVWAGNILIYNNYTNDCFTGFVLYSTPFGETLGFLLFCFFNRKEISFHHKFEMVCLFWGL